MSAIFGAGAIATGGFISLIKSFPLIVRTFSDSMKSIRNGGAQTLERTSQNLSMRTILIGIVLTTLVIWLFPAIPVNIVGAVLIVVFGFFFATVSSRMVGLVGSTNNPVSGMAIATLIIATLVLKSTGMVGIEGMTGAIAIGSVICVIAAIAGDTSQDLKTAISWAPRRKSSRSARSWALSRLPSPSAVCSICWTPPTALTPARSPPPRPT